MAELRRPVTRLNQIVSQPLITFPEMHRIWGAVSGGYVFRKLDADEIEHVPER